MKLAIVHDYLNQFGGAERVVKVLHETFPDAPIFTSIYDKKRMPPDFKDMDIRTSFMQFFPGIMKNYKPYLPFYPRAFESMKIKGFDVILSSSSAFAKGIKNEEGALHICYCYNPMRFVWRYEDYIREEGLSPLIKAVLPIYLNRLRMWDVATSARVDHFIAISMAVARRILQYWGRDSEVIYPPVETSRFKISKDVDDYFLVVSRLKPYKKIDLVVDAFNAVKKPLKIVGGGDHEGKLKQMAGPTVEFLGAVSDEELPDIYSRCRALIFPGEEDFGIVPVEAMASGRPVIAFAKGGALETVVDGNTGIFFDRQTPQSLIEAIDRFEKMEFDPQKIKAHAASFDREVFERRVGEFLEEKYKARQGNS
jgi:glycosyltransferase involved in cell wall biosynthesis